MHACIQIKKGSMLDNSPDHSPPYFLREGLSLNLEVTAFGRPTDHGVLGILGWLRLTQWSQDTDVTAMPVFFVDNGDPNSGRPVKAGSPIMCCCHHKKLKYFPVVSFNWEQVLIPILYFRMFPESFLIPACLSYTLSLCLSADCFVTLSLYLCLFPCLCATGAFAISLLKAKEWSQGEGGGGVGEGMRDSSQKSSTEYYKGFSHWHLLNLTLLFIKKHLYVAVVMYGDYSFTTMLSVYFLFPEKDYHSTHVLLLGGTWKHGSIKIASTNWFVL